MMLTGENILLVMVVFTAATMTQSKATKRCSHFEITVVHDGNSTCVPCELCPPGQGLSVNCGATTNVFPKCVSCQEGKTFNNGKSHLQCSTCVPCGENQQLIIGKCTIYNNTQCGGCRNGYYSEDSIYDCLPCSKCCGPPDAAFIAEKCKNDGLPANHQCRIYDPRCHLYPSGTKKPGDMKLSSPSHLKSTPPEHLSSTKSTHPGYFAPSFPKPSSKQTSSKENKAKSDVSQRRLVTKKQKNKYVVVVTNPLTWVLFVVGYLIGKIPIKKWTFSSVKKIVKKDIFPMDNMNGIAHSIELICQCTERFLRDTPDASKETVIYTQRQMAKKVSDMPYDYRKGIGMRLATKNWETGPKPFLEKISVPNDEIDYICSNSELHLWEKVMEQFSRKTNGQVATLVKLLNELEREDIIQECIYKWLDGKIEKRFQNNRPLTFSTIA